MPAITPRRLSIALYVLTVAMLATGVALAAGALRSRPPEEPMPAPLDLAQAVLGGPAAQEASPAAYLTLADSPVFGPPAPAPAPPAEPVQMPVKAIVIGTIVRGELSRAIVDVGAGRQRLMRLGDSLEGGSIAEITLSEVILERGGRRIVLPVGSSGRRQLAPATPRTTPPRAIGLSRAERTEPQYEEGSVETGDIDLEDFDAFYSDLKSGFLAARAKTGHDVSGDPLGLIFEGVPERGLLWRMGLRPGDIVMEVNTIPVTSMNDLLNAFDRVAAQVRSEDESFIVIDLVRDQRPDALILTIW